MSAREKILNAIATNKPSLVDLPVMNLEEVIQYNDLVSQFKLVLQSIGGQVKELDDFKTLQDEITTLRNTGIFIINTIPEIGAIDSNLSSLSADQLAALEKAYIMGTLAVAENGAIWLYEQQMINRLIPFICQHLVMLVKKENIVATMHQAYERIDISKEGFGAFIAGPSKTADIEQSLVIGAHGARSLVVYLF